MILLINPRAEPEGLLLISPSVYSVYTPRARHGIADLYHACFAQAYSFDYHVVQFNMDDDFKIKKKRFKQP